MSFLCSYNHLFFCSSTEGLCVQVSISSSLAPSAGPMSELLTAPPGLKGKLVLIPGAGGIYLAGGNIGNPPVTDGANISLIMSLVL